MILILMMQVLLMPLITLTKLMLTMCVGGLGGVGGGLVSLRWNVLTTSHQRALECGLFNVFQHILTNLISMDSYKGAVRCLNKISLCLLGVKYLDPHLRGFEIMK